MTHTHHRVGDLESLKKDYVVFLYTAKGTTQQPGSAARKRRVIPVFAKYDPVNMGAYRSPVPRTITIADGHTPEEMVDWVDDTSSVYAVYTDIDTVTRVLTEVKQRDEGLSIVVAGVFDEVFKCCDALGIRPHTVNISAGIMGKVRLLPEKEILEITTMCGHGCVSQHLVRYLIKRVKAQKMTPEEAAGILAKPCVCGVFNTARATDLIRKCTSTG